MAPIPIRDPDSGIMWTFWKDLEFLHLSLEMDEGNQDNVKWSNEETGKFLLYFYSILLSFIWFYRIII